MKKSFFLLIAAAILLITSACGQQRTAKEQTILNVFGRLNLAKDPFNNIFTWSDGEYYCRPFFFDTRELDSKPRAIGDTIYFSGGSLNEGGYGMTVLLTNDGKMTITNDDYPYRKGDRVEYRTLGNEALLLITDARTGDVKSVLKKINGNLFDQRIANFYRYILDGKFEHTDGAGETVVFNQKRSAVSGFLSTKETPYTFIKEFGTTPIPVLRFSDDMVFKANRTLIGMELIPILTGQDIDQDYDLEWQIEEDHTRPAITLIKTAAGRSDLPSGFFPLASVQVMTLPELIMYAGVPTLRNLSEMRNEIFARHGYIFKTNEWADYFGTKDWYWPKYGDVTDKLTEIERINIQLIQILEKNN